MNTVQLVGRLTREVDLRFTSSGIAVGTFTLAVYRNFTNQQGEREADFISCVIWRKAAENLANFTRKGSQIGVEGRIQTRNYENQQGQRVYVTEVVVNNFHLLEPRSVTEQRPVGDNQSMNTYGQQSNYNQNNHQQSDSFGQSYGQETQRQSNPSFASQQESNNNPFDLQEGHQIDISEDDLPF